MKRVEFKLGIDVFDLNDIIPLPYDVVFMAWQIEDCLKDSTLDLLRPQLTK